MAPHLVSSVLVGGEILAPGTEETAELRSAVPNETAWSAPTELSEAELQAVIQDDTGSTDASDSAPVDVDEQIATAVETAVAVAKDELLDELRAELRTLLAEMMGTVDAAEVSSGSPSSTDVEEPPRGGKGSGEEAWRAYAAAIDLNVDEVADRDGIITLVDARKVAGS